MNAWFIMWWVALTAALLMVAVAMLRPQNGKKATLASILVAAFVMTGALSSFMQLLRQIFGGSGFIPGSNGKNFHLFGDVWVEVYGIGDDLTWPLIAIHALMFLVSLLASIFIAEVDFAEPADLSGLETATAAPSQVTSPPSRSHLSVVQAIPPEEFNGDDELTDPGGPSTPRPHIARRAPPPVGGEASRTPPVTHPRDDGGTRLLGLPPPASPLEGDGHTQVFTIGGGSGTAPSGPFLPPPVPESSPLPERPSPPPLAVVSGTDASGDPTWDPSATVAGPAEAFRAAVSGGESTEWADPPPASPTTGSGVWMAETLSGLQDDGRGGKPIWDDGASMSEGSGHTGPLELEGEDVDCSDDDEGGAA